LNVPDDFHAFINEVNRAFNNSWAPRAAFEEIFNFNTERDAEERDKVNKLRKVMNEDYMTTYMLDAIENGAIAFITSLGHQWRPLLRILSSMTLNERRSFCCKILYQRMQELRLEEMARSLNEPKPFQRITTPLTAQEKRQRAEKRYWDENMSEEVRAAYMAPKKLTARYGITVAQLQIRGHYHPPVAFMADFCMRAAYYFGLPATGPVPLPRRIERWTVIRAPFIFKKTQENFERRTYSRLVTVKDGHPDIVEMWISYCIQNAYHGTGMKAHVFSHDRIGVGKTMQKDIQKLIETDRWAVDGYNTMADDAALLQETVNKEVLRIESQIANRETNDRAKRVLQDRMSQIKLIEDKVYEEFPEDWKEPLTKKQRRWRTLEEQRLKQESKDEEPKSDDEATKLEDEATSQVPQFALVKDQLPQFQLAKEVEWDMEQDNALRKHLLHVGQYARQKGIGPLTREEYFVYVPYVLLPKYKGIHKDVFQGLIERDMLRIPVGNAGYLADWDNLTERKRYDLVMAHRQNRIGTMSETETGDKATTSRLARIMETRRKRELSGFSVGPFQIRLSKTDAKEGLEAESIEDFLAKQQQISQDPDGKHIATESTFEEVAPSQGENSPDLAAESPPVGVEMESEVPSASTGSQGETDVISDTEPEENLQGEEEDHEDEDHEEADPLGDKQSENAIGKDDKGK